MFYTRIPVGNIIGWHEDLLNKATRYFPFIGILVGGVAAFLLWSLSFTFPISIALILSMIGTIYLTGAFHEDGFADFCDGFGGGYTKEKVLEIMKDSRIGTYGSIGLIMILGVKFLSLNEIQVSRIPFILIAGHTISRVMPVIMIYTSEYARLDATSKTKPVGKKDSSFSLIFAIITGGITLFFLSGLEILVSISVLLLVFLIFRRYINKKLGGYTGDVLGALQQLCEVFFYLSMVAIQTVL